MFYKYKITHYDNYRGDEVTDEGLVFAKSYSEAACFIGKDYSDIIALYLYEITSDGDYTLNKEEIDNAFKVN